MKRLFKVRTYVAIVTVCIAFTTSFAQSPQLERAAKNGDPKAQYELGQYYEGRLNDVMACMYYKRAAKQKDPKALNELGERCINGQDPYSFVSEEDRYAKAFKFFKAAEAKGNTFGTVNLGAMYFYGWGVKKNTKKALKCFEKAMAKGNYDAATALANMYRDGLGVKKNEAKADELDEKSLELFEASYMEGGPNLEGY